MEPQVNWKRANPLRARFLLFHTRIDMTGRLQSDSVPRMQNDRICALHLARPDLVTDVHNGGAVRAGRDQRAVTVRAHAFSTWVTLPACGYPPPGRTGARVARGAVQASRASTWGQGW
jgi:hypothetical protein